MNTGEAKAGENTASGKVKTGATSRPNPFSPDEYTLLLHNKRRNSSG